MGKISSREKKYFIVISSSFSRYDETRRKRFSSADGILFFIYYPMPIFHRMWFLFLNVCAVLCLVVGTSSIVCLWKFITVHTRKAGQHRWRHRPTTRPSGAKTSPFLLFTHTHTKEQIMYSWQRNDVGHPFFSTLFLEQPVFSLRLTALFA